MLARIDLDLELELRTETWGTRRCLEIDLSVPKEAFGNETGVLFGFDKPAPPTV